MAADPHWIEYVKAFSVPIASIVAAYIAWRQWMTAQNKLRLDLFDRRMKAYDALWMSIKYVKDNDQVDYAKVMQLNADVEAIKWLFDLRLYEHVRDKIHRRAMDLIEHYRELEGRTPTGSGIQWRVSSDPQTEALRKAVQDAANELHALFDPFMRVSAG